MKKITCYTLLCCLTAFAQTAFAQATLSIQGIIQKSSGAAVEDGKYDLTFKLYPTTSGGTAVHTETQTVTVAGGIYSAELGGGSTPLTAPFDQTYYLGVSVDGSAELVPRTRLTSSPYALSLLGTENLFSSAGTVGIGTVTPTSGYQLHTKKATGAGKILLEGNDAAQLDFKKGSTVGSIGFGSANNNFVLNPGANNTALQYNGSTKLTVTTNGATLAGTLDATTVNAGTLTATNYSPATLAVTSKLAVGQNAVDANNAFKVVGNTFLNGYVEINGNSPLGGGFNGWGFYQQTGLAYQGANTYYISLKASNSVLANSYFASSDRRIKKDLQLSSALADLAILRKLRVTDYRLIDEVHNGTDFTKGFIAQEVKETFPQAVKMSESFIPNVYALATKAQLAAGKMTISTAKNHEFAVGDEVKLILEKGEKIGKVTAVPTENTFTIDWNEAASDKIFVYGKKVQDFHSVDYDRIATLNVSATQELARKVELLEKENAALRSELGASKADLSRVVRENTQMKASAEKFDARLRALENRISN